MPGAVHGKTLNIITRLAHGANGTAARRAELEAFDRLAPREQEHQVMARVRRLLEHAFANVPYWAQTARERGLSADDFHTYADMAKLPLLTKDCIRENFEALKAVDGPQRNVKRNHTGGSTGVPLTFLQDDEYRQYNNADKTRLYERCNYRLGDSLVFLWGSDYDSAAHNTPLRRLADRLGMNLIWINTFTVTEDDLARYAAAIARHNPVLIVGYVSSLVMYANFLKQRQLPRPSPRAVQTSAEVLTGADRALLGEVFGCEIFDRYGCREVGIIAHECEQHRGLHISQSRNLLELVDAGGDAADYGQVGRVIVTNLHNHAMPFIRYEPGDLAVMDAQPCPCGRATPLLTAITGRTTDIIVSPRGKLLHGEAFTRMFYKRPDVKQFQVVQETVNNLKIRMVPHDGGDLSEIKNYLAEAIRLHLDPDFIVDFEICENIAPSASGKNRYIISKLDKPFGGSETK